MVNETYLNELQKLRRCNRDLIALSTLPALWTNSNRIQIAESLVTVLLDTLQLDVVLLSLKAQRDEIPFEVVRTKQGTVTQNQVEKWTTAFLPLLKLDHQISQSVSIFHPFENQELFVRNVPIGYDGFYGVLIAASQRRDFPSEDDSLLLNIGTNQIAITLERRRVEDKLRDTEARYRLATRATNDVIWDWDLINQSIQWNENIEKLFGYSLHEGRFDTNWRYEHIHPEDRSRVIDGIYRLIESGESHWSDEYRFLKRDGSYAVLFDRGYIVHNEQGKAVRMIGAMLDVTQRKQAEEIKEKALKEARDALQARDEFVSIASHELKTPLTSLHLQLQLLGRNLEQTKKMKASPQEIAVIPVEQISKIVHSCIHQTKKLTALLDDLLDLTRIRLGKFELNLQEVNLVRIVKEVANRFQAEIDKKGIVLNIVIINEDAIGIWDLLRIEQIVTNLISNAIKYGEGSPIDITILKDRDFNRVILEVKDQGVGIPLDLHAKIFERFERVAKDQRISGLGLGLYITRQIVEVHGGTIDVKSEIGRGAKFIVELPGKL